MHPHGHVPHHPHLNMTVHLYPYRSFSRSQPSPSSSHRNGFIFITSTDESRHMPTHMSRLLMMKPMVLMCADDDAENKGVDMRRWEEGHCKLLQCEHL